jgi:dihydrofolate synthase/folylpolyglutamate synthase
MRERIKLDGRDITEQDFLACFLRVESAAAGELSFFETLTAVAFLYFSLKKTRFAVVEAGLGGGLDATNAADGAVAGITSVSLEHVALLGPGLAEIAAHKAGIIKGGAAVIVGLDLPPAALRVIERRTAAVGARLFVPARAFPPAMLAAEKKILKAGRFQLGNALFAVKTAALAARLAGLKLDKLKAYAALPAAIPPGRFEVFEIKGRRVVVDGAHNPEGLAALLKEFPGERPVCVAAFMGDKALGPLARKLAGAASRLILTRSHSYRSAAPEDIKKLLPPDVRRKALVIEDPLGALGRAVTLAAPGGTVLVTGSLYLAGDILSGLKGRKAFHPGEMLVK